MKTERKIELLEKLIIKAKEITRETSSDPDFLTWKSLVERTFIQIFGDNSFEVKEFQKLNFRYKGIRNNGRDYSASHLRQFQTDFKVTLDSIHNYIEELEEIIKEEKNPLITTPIVQTNDSRTKKVFISHASNDSPIVEELIEILESLGLKSENIFCTSFSEYGIPLGENFLDRIKTELTSEVLVLFLLSENFYNSPVCLCEMGAAWALTKEHIPILIPPFDFSQVKGVFPSTQGFKINDASKMNLFKEKIEQLFQVTEPLPFTNWERKRDRVIRRIQDRVNN